MSSITPRPTSTLQPLVAARVISWTGQAGYCQSIWQFKLKVLDGVYFEWGGQYAGNVISINSAQTFFANISQQQLIMMLNFLNVKPCRAVLHTAGCFKPAANLLLNCGKNKPMTTPWTEMDAVPLTELLIQAVIQQHQLCPIVLTSSHQNCRTRTRPSFVKTCNVSVSK